MKIQYKDAFKNQLEDYLPSTRHPSYESWKKYHLEAIDRGFGIVQLLGSMGLCLKGRRVLDVGCGTCGPYVSLATSGSEVVGVDIFRSSLKVGKSRIASKGLDASLVVASAQYLPFRDNWFDIVLFSDVIEHTQNPNVCVDEIFHVLNEGGAIYGTSPNFFSFLNFMHDPHFQLPLVSILPPSIGKMIEQKIGRGGEEIRMFTIWGIVKLFTNHGFMISIVDDSQTTKKFKNPRLIQSKNSRLFVSIMKRTRTVALFLWLMKIFYTPVHQFLCVKKSGN